MLIQLGLEVSADDLIITAGSQQGVYLTASHYIRPGDWVIVESPTYPGILAMLEQLGAQVIGIPMTAEGINLTLLEQHLRSHQPKLICTISTLQNPTGITMPQSHRQALLELADRYRCPILEDNAYEGLNFEPVPLPLKAIDQNGWVTYLGTFSKTLMPGLRVGYLVANPDTHRALLEQKLMLDLHASTVSQAIVSEYLASGHHRRHLNHLRATYQQNRNAMLQALEQHFPEAACWTVPQGGIFLWVQLPEQCSVQAICHEALAENILIGNGAAFFPGQQGYPAMRLSFLRPPEEIERGIATLGRIVRSHCISLRSL
jgi:DNA-binding transcriptional MocR family regulator